ncbi:MAG TPA: response regulator transcription factor [Stellaceae bacterium]|nr:response regulator transcription factor [Stellaceae bacterium]
MLPPEPRSDDAPSGGAEAPAFHVLVVEDDAAMRHLIACLLQQNGFRCTGARNGAEMWEILARLPIDLVLLDIMLPGTGGMDLCRTLRGRSNVPIIVVTARGSETDRVLGLELGADDYLLKPFSGPELVARIRAVLRRSRMSVAESPAPRGRHVRFAGRVLDLARRELTAPDGSVVDLSAAEYDTLMAFLEHPQRVLGREQLLELARNRLGDVHDRAIDVLVSRLRRKIETGPPDPPMIKTVRGAGYMFVPEVSRS